MDKRIVMIPFEIVGEFVDDVLCTAFEGGINYWCSGVEVVGNDYKGAEYASEVLSRGGNLKIHLDEQFDENNTGVYDLTLDKFIEGYKKYVEWSVKHNRRFYTDPADIDSVEADIIVQFALFDEIIFG